MLRGIGDRSLQNSWIQRFIKVQPPSNSVLGENLGGADRFGPTQNSNLFNHIPQCFQTYFDFVGFTSVLNVCDFHHFHFQFSNFRNLQDSTTVKFRFYEYLAKRRLFWTQENNPEFIKFPKSHFMLCSRYWYHLSKTPFMFFDRYWFHIQDL